MQLIIILHIDKLCSIYEETVIIEKRDKYEDM
jgi:hypothetical protein